MDRVHKTLRAIAMLFGLYRWPEPTPAMRLAVDYPYTLHDTERLLDALNQDEQEARMVLDYCTQHSLDPFEYIAWAKERG